MDRKRPVGVTVVAVWFIIMGIPSLLFALLACISGHYGKTPLMVDIIIRLLVVSFPVGLVASAIGLLDMKEWGRKCAILTAIVLAMTSLAMGAFGLVSQRAKTAGNSSIVFSLYSFLIVLLFLIVMYYLTRQGVKERFGG